MLNLDRWRADEVGVRRWITTGVLLVAAACGSAAARPPVYPAGAVITDETVAAFVEDFGSGGVSWLSGGEGADVVDVGLTAESEPLAAAMRQFFEGRFEITLGAWPYPMPDGLAARCGEVRVLREPHPGLDVLIELDSPTIAAGEHVTGRVVITNTTDVDNDAVFSMVATGALVDPGTTYARNLDTGFMKLAGVGGPRAGASIELPLRVDLATCDPADGYRVAPGEYEVVYLGAVVPITIEAA